MPTRTPAIGGNWKMNTDRASAVALAEAVAGGCSGLSGQVEVIVYPPFPYLDAVGQALRPSGVALGAQDLYHEPKGAFTGEVSAAMLLDLGVTHVLVGHSERRHVIGEHDRLVNRKLLAGLDAGLIVTLCVGETLAQREAGETDWVNVAQLETGLADVERERLGLVTIAYEPVWAIGTGRTATPEDAQSVHAMLRGRLRDLYDASAADSVRIQYGGSVNANNAADLFAGADVDGGLIGGASLKAADFTAIVRAAASAVPA